jgi:hypothetical protein
VRKLDERGLCGHCRNEGVRELQRSTDRQMLEAARDYGAWQDEPRADNTPEGYGYQFPPDAGGVNGARRPMLPGETWKEAKRAPQPTRDPAVRDTSTAEDPYG